MNALLFPAVARQRLWFLDQLEPGNPAYNVPVAYHVQGRLNVAALAQRINTIVHRHEVLRKTFPAELGRPMQVIAPEVRIPVSEVDLSEMPEAERWSEAQRLATAEAQQPFCLATGPLLRMKLLHLCDTAGVLLLTMHHIVSDDWFIEVFMRESAY